MSCWLTIPSARPVDEVNRTMDVWRSKGYRVALWRDEWVHEAPEQPKCDFIIKSPVYLGYPVAVNALAEHVFRMDPDCNWVVAAGDDTTPDPIQTADTIAIQLTAHFNGSFGICQPTGDPWRDVQGRIIERIAGSPFIGREFCRRIYGGKGPLWSEFTHCFADEHLLNVATKLGIYWPRPDLCHYHANWSRKDGATYERDMPAFLKDANSPEHWAKYKAVFERLKAGGFAEANDLLP